MECEQLLGIAPPSMVSIHLDSKDLTPAQDQSLKWAASNMYAGGVDTASPPFFNLTLHYTLTLQSQTTSVLSNFALFMVLYPDVQARAQAEVDALLGDARLPSVHDVDGMPYLRALVSELLRYALVAPQGLPHVAREDDIHDGCFIPKGAMILYNIQCVRFLLLLLLVLCRETQETTKTPISSIQTAFSGMSPSSIHANTCLGMGNDRAQVRYISFALHLFA